MGQCSVIGSLVGPLEGKTVSGHNDASLIPPRYRELEFEWQSARFSLQDTCNQVGVKRPKEGALVQLHGHSYHSTRCCSPSSPREDLPGTTCRSTAWQPITGTITDTHAHQQADCTCTTVCRAQACTIAFASPAWCFSSSAPAFYWGTSKPAAPCPTSHCALSATTSCR